MRVKLDYQYPAEPTVYRDGLDRMLRIWEASRDANTGGYGSGTLFSVWGHHVSTVTSCTPFTGTCIGMMFDPGSGESTTTKYKPKYHNGQLDLPSAFYGLHNGFLFKDRSMGPAYLDAFKRNGWPTCNPSDEEGQERLGFEFFNLAYRIDPRDMRRGDFVGIKWTNGDGHGTFCWDVHYDQAGAVDAFLFLSANCHPKKGGGVEGEGVSVATLPGCASEFITRSGTTYKKKGQLFKDDDKFAQYGMWVIVPPLTRTNIDIKTFKTTPSKKSWSFVDCAGGFGPAELQVYRFWGFPPPESPHGKLLTPENRERAQDLAKGHQPESKVTGAGKPPEGRITNISTNPVPKSHPDPTSVPSPKPAKQPKEQTLPHQHFVEAALTKLHEAKWIDKSPGKLDFAHDSQTRDAVRDFQTKFDAKPIDGIPGPITRAALHKALADLYAGKPNPNKPDVKPKIERVYWKHNRVEPAGTAKMTIEGEHLDLMQAFELMLHDAATGRTHAVKLPKVGDPGRASVDVAIPDAFVIGVAIVAELTGTHQGAQEKKSSSVPLHVGKLDQPPGDWPWDEKLWTQQMRDVIADLRGTPAPPGPYDQFEITQFGVKERIEPGTIEVKSPKGQVFGTCSLRSLMLADIEGTMRLDGRILNIAKSGNVYEPKEVVVNGKKVIKKKPVAAKFDPSKSLWVDVTAKNPWGAGSHVPLIPYRVLAVNPQYNRALYRKKVYIKALDGLQMEGTNERHNGMCVVGDTGGMRATHFDLFVGREDHHIRIPSIGKGDATISEIKVLGDCGPAHKR